MPLYSIIIGIILIAIGLAGYFGTGTKSKTALIPAGFGIALVACGLLANMEGWAHPASVASTVIALLGFLGSVKGFLKLPALIAGKTVERPAAVRAQSFMAAACLALVVSNAVASKSSCLCDLMRCPAPSPATQQTAPNPGSN